MSAPREYYILDIEISLLRRVANAMHKLPSLMLVSNDDLSSYSIAELKQIRDSLLALTTGVAGYSYD